MITIERLVEATPRAVEELIALGRDLHSDDRTMSIADLEEILRDDSAICMVVLDNGRIKGMATLYIIPKFGSKNRLLEDVIVSSEYRGQGLGEKLVKSLIEEAKARRVRSISLTSRPVRVASHKLYQKLGFEKKETEVFKLFL